MKTNQILIRKMGDFGVMQRTSDGMFNATALIKQWNYHRSMKKEIKDYFENNSSKEFISTIVEKENLHGGNLPYVKSRASRGKNVGTWMHPLLFIDFAMWISPSFKYDVLRFVYDKLIEYRNDAGDAYREMATAIQMVVDKEFFPVAISNVARAINHIIFGNHASGMRNKQADESLMRDLLDLERKIASLIAEGFIRTYEQLINYLLRLWLLKYQPVCLIVSNKYTSANAIKGEVKGIPVGMNDI